MLSVSFRPQRLTLKGVKQNGTFSVNIPSVDQVKETDYCGTFSGRDRDKVADCKFTVFYGKWHIPVNQRMPDKHGVPCFAYA